MRLTESLVRSKGQIGLVVFDVDGVLIDTSRSFPEAISKALVHYGKMILGKSWEPPAPDLIAAFKTIPGFNNDWDLEEGILVFYLQREILPAPLSISRYLETCLRRGGGMVAVRGWMNELSPPDKKRFQDLFNAELIRRLAMEYYAGGKYCRELYGFDPLYVKNAGTLELEEPLVDTTKLQQLSQSRAIGIYSGRSPQELHLIATKIGLELFPAENIVCDDGKSLVKPSPRPLVEIARRVGVQNCVLVGDSYDDFQTAVNVNQMVAELECEFVQVTHMNPFSQSISVVENVNQILDFFLGEDDETSSNR